jgi:putative transcriptional regulator
MAKKAYKLKISNRVHVFRAERRMTQQQLAEAIDVTRATINALERGHYNPSLELAFKLSLFFKTDIHSIFSTGKQTPALLGRSMTEASQ